MLKRFMTTTTALVALSITPALAQDTGSDENRRVFEREPGAEMFYDANTTHMLASNLIGSYIYTGTGDDAEAVGDVNDIVFSTEGSVKAVIAGIGGFLGIGEKEVAISIDQLNWRTGPDGERWLVGDLSKEQLEEAPEFDRDILTERQQAMVDPDREADAENNAADADTETADADTENQTADTENQTADADNQTADATEETEREFVPIMDATFEADNLIGMDVHGAQGEDIGEVGDVLISSDGKVEAVIIDVGGFLGIGEKQVAVSLQNMMVSRADGAFDWSVAKVNLTEEELEKHTEFSRSEYESDPDSVILVAPEM